MDAKDLPDLDHVEETIAAAREAKDNLLDVDPPAINPTEDETAPTDNDTDADTGVAEASDGPRTASDDPD